MNGVFAIAGAEKWTYANHCTNYALNAVFPNYNVTAAATKEDVDKLEEPLVKMVQELDMLSSYTARTKRQGRAWIRVHQLNSDRISNGCHHIYQERPLIPAYAVRRRGRQMRCWQMLPQ